MKKKYYIKPKRQPHRFKLPNNSFLGFVVPSYFFAPVVALLEDGEGGLFVVKNIWPRNWHKFSLKKRVMICGNCYD